MACSGTALLYLTNTEFLVQTVLTPHNSIRIEATAVLQDCNNSVMDYGRVYNVAFIMCILNSSTIHDKSCEEIRNVSVMIMY
jgi:hypothetical protein